MMRDMEKEVGTLGRLLSPLQLLPRFRQAYRSLGEWHAREGWPREQIEAFQLERLNVAWERARVESAYYRELARAQGLPPRFSSLDEYAARMPLLTKGIVRERPEALRSARGEAGSWRLTGGSTGTTTRVFWSRRSHLENLQAKYALHATWGIDIFDRAVYLWGHGASFAPGLAGRLARVRRPIEDFTRNRLRLSAYLLGRDDLRRHLDAIQAFRPAWIYAYSSAAYVLAREAAATGFRSSSLKCVVLSSEPAYPRIIRSVEDAFGVPCVVEYGSVECGFIAGEGRDRRLRVRDDLVFVETLPRHDGRFDIVITVLGNPSFPLLRYKIEDTTDRPIIRPEAGFGVLANVAGRVNDILVTRRARPVHSSRFELLFERYEAIRRYRLHQRQSGDVDLDLEVDTPGPGLSLAPLVQEIEAVLEGCVVRVRLVDTLDGNSAGKHRWILSDVGESMLSIADDPVRAGASV